MPIGYEAGRERGDGETAAHKIVKKKKCDDEIEREAAIEKRGWAMPGEYEL